MGQRGIIRRIAIAVNFLVLSCSFWEARDAALSQEVPKDYKAALKERDRLHNETLEFQASGNLCDAITSANAMLAIEQKVLPADHEDIIGSLDWLGRLYVEHADFASAKVTRQQALDLLKKRYGEKHWKVTDARLELDDVDRGARMPQQQRKKLAEANRLKQDIFTFYRVAKYDAAIALARREILIRKAVRGDRHPEYAQSLNNLAALLGARGDYAAARPLYENAHSHQPGGARRPSSRLRRQP